MANYYNDEDDFESLYPKIYKKILDDLSWIIVVPHRDSVTYSEILNELYEFVNGDVSALEKNLKKVVKNYLKKQVKQKKWFDQFEVVAEIEDMWDCVFNTFEMEIDGRNLVVDGILLGDTKCHADGIRLESDQWAVEFDGLCYFKGYGFGSFTPKDLAEKVVDAFDDYGYDEVEEGSSPWMFPPKGKSFSN